MSDRIVFNAYQREARPFWKSRPFINPDKAISRNAVQYKKKDQDPELDLLGKVSLSANFQQIDWKI